MTSLRFVVNALVVAPRERSILVRDRPLTPDMVPVIKLARLKGIPYSWIATYFGGLNFGRIADVMKGRRFPDIPPADRLPSDFPKSA
jgi:hypothetical protein